MSSISCNVTEVFVAVGDSYWRCVSCQLQFSRQVSIDEHITLKHGGNECDRHTLTTVPCTTHTVVSQIPLSSYQNQNIDNAVTGHQLQITSCLIPEVVKVNLDISTIEKTSTSNESNYNTSTCTRSEVSDLSVNKDPEVMNFQYSLPNHESSLCHNNSEPLNERNFRNSDRTNGNDTVVDNDSKLTSNNGLPDSLTVSEPKQNIDMDSNYDAEEEDGDRGNRSLLNSMLSLLEKSMDMDDINGVIQNWDTLNPELLEQQLLNNNSELSPHSPQHGCVTLDPVENPLDTTEELLSTAVESINSQVEFLNASTDLLQSALSEENSKRTVVGNEDAAVLTQPDSGKLTLDSMQASKSDVSCDNISSQDVDMANVSDQESEDEDDDTEESEESEINENIVECLKSFLNFSASQSKLFDVIAQSYNSLTNSRMVANSSVGNINGLEKRDFSSFNLSSSASSASSGGICLNKDNIMGASGPSHGVKCVGNKTSEDGVRVCSKSASELAKLCLRRSRLAGEGNGLAVPRLFIASSGSPFAQVNDSGYQSGLQKPSAHPNSEDIQSELTVKENHRTVSEETGKHPQILNNSTSSSDSLTQHMNETDSQSSQQRTALLQGNSLLFEEFSHTESCDAANNLSLSPSSDQDLPAPHSSGPPSYSAKTVGEILNEVSKCSSTTDTLHHNKPNVIKESTVEDSRTSDFTQMKAERYNKHRTSNASLSLLQIKKLKSDVLAIMKSQYKASKTTSKSLVRGEPKSQDRKRKRGSVTSAEKEAAVKQYQSLDIAKEGETSEKWKTCQICDRRFSTHRALQRHMKVNSTYTDPCKCKVCEKKFHGLSQLNIHIYKFHGIKGNPTCLRCNARFKNVSCLSQHVQKYQQPIEAPAHASTSSPTKGKAWKCNTCSMVCLNQPKVIAAHRCKSHQRKCTKCDKKFQTRSALNVHMAAHLGRMYECDVCGQFFKNKMSRHHHKLTHESVKGQFLCQVCGQQFEFQNKLTAHIKIHTKDKRQQPTFKCSECDRDYKSKKCLQRHVNVVHRGIKDYEYKCEHCQQQFFTSWQLRDHIAWHHFGEKPYHCQYCGQGFVCRPTLVRHQRKEHTGVKPHKCRYCSEAFVDKKNLDIHEVKVHTGLFPFACTHCGKGFVHRSSLRTHQMQHTNSRPHQCHICGNAFTKASHLKRHTVSCMKKNNVPTNETLSLDMEHLPNIPPRPPSNLTSLMLPQQNNILPYPGAFLTQNF